MDKDLTHLPPSLSRENSWSNEPSTAATDTSQRSRVSDVMTSEPEVMKTDPGTKPQKRMNDSKPVSHTEHTSPDAAIGNDSCKPLQSDVSLKLTESAEVIEHVNDSGPLPNAASFTEHRSSDVTTDSVRVCKALSSDVISLKLSAPADAVEESAETAVVTDSNTITGGHRDEVFSEKTAHDVVGNGAFLLDAVDGKCEENVEASDSEATPRNDRSVQENDISIHLDHTLLEDQISSSTTLSSRGGMKVSPVHLECQLPQSGLYNEMSASIMEPQVRETSPKHATFTGAVCLKDKSEDLKKLSPGSHGENISQLAEFQPDLQQASSPGSRPTSSSSRHSASGASTDGASGTGKTPIIQSTRSDHGKAPIVDSGHSNKAETASSRSIDSIHSHSVSSKVHSISDGDQANSHSIKSDSISRQVSGKAESVQTASRSSIHSGVSSKTLSVVSEDSVKDRSIRSGSDTSHPPASLHQQVDIALPVDAVHWIDNEVELRGDAAADTDDDVADLEPDVSLHAPKPPERVLKVVDMVSTAPIPIEKTEQVKPKEKVLEIIDKILHASLPEVEEKLDGTKPTERVLEIVDKVSGPSIQESEDKTEARLDAESMSIKDEQMPEDLDTTTDSELNEDGHHLVHSAVDAWVKNTSEEPQSDTSVESRSGKKSEELHRIIGNAAAAVESFITEDEHASSVNTSEEHLPEDRCGKVVYRFFIITTLILFIDFIYCVCLISVVKQNLETLLFQQDTDFLISYFLYLVFAVLVGFHL